MNSTHQKVSFPQMMQQKKNLIPKNLKSMNIPNNNSNNIQIVQNQEEEPKMPRDSIRQKNNNKNTHLPKVESSNSYQLLGNNQINARENILSGNFNSDMDFGDNKLSNTNFEMFVPNKNNEIDYGQQYNEYDNEIINNDLGYKI